MNRSLQLRHARQPGPPRAAMRGMALACALGVAAWMPVAQAQAAVAAAAAPSSAQAAAVPMPATLSAPARYPSLPAISAGARLAANCAACHGTNGVTDGIALPSLAGQGKGVLLVALKAFKSGARQGTIMPRIAKGYTDEQLAQLAEFFAAQPAAPRMAGTPTGSRR